MGGSLISDVISKSAKTETDDAQLWTSSSHARKGSGRRKCNGVKTGGVSFFAGDVVGRSAEEVVFAVEMQLLKRSGFS